MRNNRRKGIIFGIFFLFIIVGIVLIEYFSVSKNQFEDQMIMINLQDKYVEEVEEYVKTHHLLLKKEYQYHHSIEKDKVISQSIEEGTILKDKDTVFIVVSKGPVPYEVYLQYQVNELGKVPIMMYHGIINIQNDDTEYTGGNVDQEGYNRTVEAFRDDLEFYYQNGYRMIRLQDYVDGNIEVELGYSPIILTFDDGSENNFKVLGEENGELQIDPNCAVGVLEEFKKKYPDYGVTATFFLNSNLFHQDSYNGKILKWLVEHGYDIGNHTMTHVDFTKIGVDETIQEIGQMYSILEETISSQYVSIVALPFGAPYQKTHENYSSIVDGTYDGKNYHTNAILRVGWEAEVSCFDQYFDPFFLKRIRAYDHLGTEFDIEMNFKLLEDSRYISDGDSDTIVVLEEDVAKVKNSNKIVLSYSSS